MKCTKCGRDNSEDSGLCAGCGAPLGVSPREVTKPAEKPSKPVHQTVEIRPDTAAVLGTLIADKYEIVEEIGRGGMGLVFRARDVKLDRSVAVKRLHSQEEGGIFGIERFRQEAKAIAALNHPNIVVIHELGEDAGGPFIVMELVEGNDLGTRVLEGGPIALGESLVLMKAVCEGVAYAHRQGVVHRDIKPSNVLLTGDNLPKLVDFGLARIGTKSDLSQTGLGMGTLSYVAPEQMTDAKSADNRSDIYSLGKTFYEVLTGESPETVDYELVPKQVKDVLRKCLRTKPDERYPSVEDMLADLGDVEKQVSRSSVYFDDLGPGVCASCGGTNDLDARFCTSCGAGLFSVCPSCGQEVRMGLRFCKHCRTDIPVYVEIQNHLVAVSRYMEERKYAKVVRGCRSILELDENHEDAKEFLKVAGEALEKLEELKKAMESAIGESNVEKAQEIFEKAEALTDSTTWLTEQDEKLAEAIINLDLEDARSKLEEGFYGDARWSARQAVKLGSSDAHLLLLMIQDKKRGYTAKLKEASEAISSGRYGDVKDILEDYKDMAGCEAARDLLERAKDTAGTVDRTLERARSCLEAGAVTEGLEACEESLRSEAHRKEAEEVKEKLERLKTEIEELLQRGEKECSDQEYEKAVSTFREVTVRASREGTMERSRAEEGIAAAEESLDALRDALKEARKKLESGDWDQGLEACEKALSVQTKNREAKAIKEEFERAKIRQTAETMAKEAFQAGNYPRAIELWEAMLKISPEASDVARNLDEAKLAVRRREVRRVASLAVMILVLALAFIGYMLVRGSDPLAEARELARTGRYEDALGAIESLREEKGEIAGASLLERSCRFEIALKELGAIMTQKRWKDMAGLITQLRKGLLGEDSRKRLGKLVDDSRLLEETGKLLTERKLLAAACAYSVLHLTNPKEGYLKRARRELEWLGEDLIAKKKYDEALVLVEKARVLLDGQELGDIARKAREGKKGK